MLFERSISKCKSLINKLFLRNPTDIFIIKVKIKMPDLISKEEKRRFVKNIVTSFDEHFNRDPQSIGRFQLIVRHDEYQNVLILQIEKVRNYDEDTYILENKIISFLTFDLNCDILNLGGILNESLSVT